MPVLTSQLTISARRRRRRRRACSSDDGPAREPGRVALRRQRQRDTAGRSCTTADRLHADERVQARRAVRAPRLGLGPDERRDPLVGQRQRGALHGPRPAERETELGLARGQHKVLFWTNAWNIPATTRSATRPSRSSSRSRAARSGPRLPRSPSSRSREREGTTTMITTTHSASSVTKVAAASSQRWRVAPAPAAALGSPRPVAAPGAPRRGGAARARDRPAKPAATMAILKTTPDIALPGTAITISGAGLPAGQGRHIIWATATVTGSSTPGPTASTTSAARRTRSTSCSRPQRRTRAARSACSSRRPQDFGGIHDVYAVIDGVQVAKGGFLVARSGYDQAEERADRHDDHRHVHRARLVACTRAARRSCTTTTTSAP